MAAKKYNPTTEIWTCCFSNVFDSTYIKRHLDKNMKVMYMYKEKWFTDVNKDKDKDKALFYIGFKNNKH